MLPARKLFCVVMIFVFPLSLAAQETGRAILRNQGGTWLNGASAPDSSAIFPNDQIQTGPGHVARINAEGSSVTIQAETVLQYRGDEILLDHGSVEVDTSRGMKVKVGCLTVVPAAIEWTQYDVTDVDGKVVVAAHKKDVNIHREASPAQRSKQSVAGNDVSVHEGDTATRDEGCPADARLPSGVGAKGPILSTPYAVGLGFVGVGVIVCKAFCFGGDNPVSPDKP